jgi:hypothetical protein
LTLGIVSLSKKCCLVIKNRLPIHIIFVDIFGYIQNSNKDKQYKPGQLQRHDNSPVFMATLSQILAKVNFFFFQDKNTDVKRLELAILVNLRQKLRFLLHKPTFCVVQIAIINFEFPIISQK